MYKKKLISSHTNILWKLSLYPLRRFHYIILLTLFILATRDMKDMNTIMNLGFIFFFAAYITFDRFYRKTSKSLTIFMSWFILTQYYYSLNYHRFENNDKLANKCKWYGLWSKSNKPNWKIGSSVYFKYAPDARVWIFLIVFKLMNMINVLFSDRKEVSKLETKCYQ